MKSIFLLVHATILMLLSVKSCRHEQGKTELISVSPVNDTSSIELIAFEKDVLPILKSRCSPCHFEGGKMFAKMPFTNPKTIIGHKEGVLRRFKEAELITLQSYLNQAAE